MVARARLMKQLVPFRSADVPPALFAAAGDRARVRFIEYFTANIRNLHTRLCERVEWAVRSFQAAQVLISARTAARFPLLRAVGCSACSPHGDRWRNPRRRREHHDDRQHARRRRLLWHP
jgi:hypothetical protein